ncbi:MAG: DoxX family membrane protein [Phycisphaerales bacterium]
MRKRDKVSLSLPSLFLRLMLAVIFIWAGLGKVRARDHVDPESAAILANMGVVRAPAAPSGGGNTPAAPLPASAKPPEPAETTKPEKPAETPANEPTKKPEGKPTEKPDAPPDAGRSGSAAGLGVLALMVQEGTPGPKHLATPPAKPADQTSPGAATPPGHSAAEFPDGADVRRVNLLALGIHHAANPSPGPDGLTPKPTWPKSLGTGRQPVYLAWAVALTGLVGGAFLLLGLLTRLCSLGVAGVMLGAMWLTQIGPAIATGKTVLGFLPQYPTFGEQWSHLLMQFALFMAAMALFFAGPGLLALDNAFFGGRARRQDGDDHDGE